MTEQQFHTYQEQTFDAYCKRVIKNAAIDARREARRMAQHEIVFSAMTTTDLAQLVFEDQYVSAPTVFEVRGYTLVVLDDQLGQALGCLIPTQREVVLLHHFHDKSMDQIAEMLNVAPTTVRYRYKAALEHLKRIIQAIDV